jgi:hypothetical protein
MYVKVFDIKGARSIEGEIQRWLNANPNIKIESMSQSSANDSSGWYYQVIIVYSTR